MNQSCGKKKSDGTLDFSVQTVILLCKLVYVPEVCTQYQKDKMCFMYFV